MIDYKIKVLNYEEELVTAGNLNISGEKYTFQVSDDNGIIQVKNLQITSAENQYYRYNYLVRIFSEPAIYDEIMLYTPAVKVSLIYLVLFN